MCKKELSHIIWSKFCSYMYLSHFGSHSNRVHFGKECSLSCTPLWPHWRFFHEHFVFSGVCCFFLTYCHKPLSQLKSVKAFPFSVDAFIELVEGSVRIWFFFEFNLQYSVTKLAYSPCDIALRKILSLSKLILKIINMHIKR